MSVKSRWTVLSVLSVNSPPMGKGESAADEVSTTAAPCVPDTLRRALLSANAAARTPTCSEFST
jgi:hypothetical protein